jgi:hypothetical protein
MGYWKLLSTSRSPFKPYKKGRAKRKKNKVPLIVQGNLLRYQLSPPSDQKVIESKVEDR